jgi:hypothetical protein
MYQDAIWANPERLADPAHALTVAGRHVNQPKVVKHIFGSHRGGAHTIERKLVIARQILAEHVHELDHGGVLDVTSLPPAMRIAPATLAEFSDTDLEASARRRLSNYEAVQQWVASLPQLTPMFDRIPAGAVPLNFPVIVSQGKREQLYFNLIGREILPTALYHTLIPEISAQQFPHSHFVCTNILNLPTHADINQTHLAAYEETLRGAIHEVFST